jgi:hypothetical protein
MGSVCITYETVDNVYTILLRNSEEKRQLGRPRRRQENYIKSYFKHDWAVWTVFTWHRLWIIRVLDMVMNISMKFWKILKQLSS